MMNNSKDLQAQQLAEGFSRRIERWSLTAAGADRGHASAAPKPPAGAVFNARAAAQAACAVSLATSAGHVCIRLSDLPPLDAGASWRAALRASMVVHEHSGADPVTSLQHSEVPSLPLVLDPQDRLYLGRYFDFERRLAQRLMRAQSGPHGSQMPDLAVENSALRRRLDQLFQATSPATAAANSTFTPPKSPPKTSPATDWQKLAAALALRGRLTVISGGPGTGKTSAVVKLLACLLDINPGSRIALAAPTGKAAVRMMDAIRDQAAKLPAALSALLPTESYTVHRLLGGAPGRGMRFHAANPLPIDALVLDEASMLDLALATQLLEAVPENARIILLGDKDQLAAVESGAVFAELSMDPGLSAACRQDLSDLTGIAPRNIVPPEAIRDSALSDCVVWFTHNFRFGSDSPIGRLAYSINSVNSGDLVAVQNCLTDAAHSELRWHQHQSTTHYEPSVLADMKEGYAPMLHAVQALLSQIKTETDTAVHALHTDIHRAYASFRVLCAMRDSPRGVDALNIAFSQEWILNLAASFQGAQGSWFCGRPVQITRNDYGIKLFNGDIGITLPDANGQLMVYFQQSDGSFRAIAPARLPPHETAFAMTVHKAQGSEFDSVVVVLPAQPNRVLTRELLYTAVTRARSQLTLYASAAVLKEALQTQTRRHSGLLARLHEIKNS